MINKKLLLLGLLRGQTLHGYGLVEYMSTHETGGAAIGKSNAYRLLKVLEADGLIRSTTERDGNRPERHVYEITPAGEKLFREQLLASLAEDVSADQPGIALLNYLHDVDPVRRPNNCKTARPDRQRHAQLDEMPDDMRRLHPAMDLSLRHAEVELHWLDEKLDELRQHATAKVKQRA